MIESKEIIVDDRAYIVTMYTATKARKLFIRLFKLIGEPLGVLAASIGTDENKELDANMIGGILRSVADKVNEDEYITLVKDLLEGVFLDHVPLVKVYDIKMAGKIGHEFKLLSEVIKFQFSDFLEILGDAKEQVASMRVSSTKSIKARSIGQSGE